MRTGDEDVMSTVDANRLFYAATGDDYDRLEENVGDEYLQAQLREILLAAVSIAPEPVRTLDACGGSGNASLVLHSFGIVPLTVDLSPEMLAVYERKAADQGLEAHTLTAEIGEFLSEDSRRWDLIVFCSALHHVDDPAGVLELAAARLAPGGVLVTAFDPTTTTRLGRRLRRLDYILHVVVRDPKRARVLIERRLRRIEPDDLTLIGDRAERHALVGINDLLLAQRLSDAGFLVIAHRRTFNGRFRATRAVYRLFRMPSTFSITLQCTTVSPDDTTAATAAPS
jgi:2-polyprenyl-3-methyl-5-hydroxy-6-metoxy-1,4-benzoquinol methylase